MLDLLIVFASSEEESSKTLFYVLGALAALYGVLVAFVGITRPDFPRDRRTARAVLATSTLVVLAAMASSIATS